MVVLFFDSVEAKDQISDLTDEISQKAEDNIRQQVHKNFSSYLWQIQFISHKDVDSILISNLPSCHFYSQEEITHLITTVVDLQKRHKQVSDECL